MEFTQSPFSTTMVQSGQKVSLPQAMALASQHHALGHLEQSETLLKRILQVQPQHAPALHLLGLINHQAGNMTLAISMISQATAISPNISVFYSNLSEICRQDKQLDLAISYGEKAVALDPQSATALSNLGIAYYDKEDLTQALSYHQRALDINPEQLTALNNMGSIAREHKDKELAITYYRQVISIAPNHLESLNNLGATLTEANYAEEAVEVLLTALELAPNYAEAHYNIATAFMTLEQLEKAEVSFNKTLSLNSKHSLAHQGLAKLYQEQRNTPKALALAEKAVTIITDDAALYSLLGSIYTDAAYAEKAEQVFATALSLDPDLASAYLGKGQLLMEQGALTEAEECFQQAFTLDASNLATQFALAQVKKVSINDDNFKHLLSQAHQLDSMREVKALPLHFALAKSYDDTNQYDLAFKHYLEGCRLKRKRIHYSADNNANNMGKIKQFFSKNRINSLRGKGCNSASPIFVLGMPRSGTTLTEQIIASHPDVHGAGELSDLLQLADHVNKHNTTGYPGSLTGLSQDDFNMLGEQYVKGLQERAPHAKHITDKMPANFICIGLIHLMLPNAKIIHVKRNPVDTCLSGFTRLFSKGQFHSYDLTEMGHFYRDYHDLMAHWKDVLPEGSFYEVQYEDLVADTENQAKALIDYCGLEWNPACLDFHKTKRNIRTASITQVRQPIYKTSVERWRSYEEHLKPLFDALGNLAPKY